MKICSRCRLELPLSSFSRSSASKDGRQSYCRECMSTWAKEHRPRKLAVPPEVPAGRKWCRRCVTVKSLDDFPRHAKTRDGRQTYCRECFAAEYRKGRAELGATTRPAVIPDGHKFCRGCSEVKPLAAFRRPAGTRKRLTFRCEECTRKRDRERHLARSYGLDQGDVDAMLEAQGGLCAICRTAPAIHIDHDHVTGAIRGMLCFRCNAALGQLGDDPATLVRAATYLLTAAKERVPMEVVWAERLAQQVEYGSAS